MAATVSMPFSGYASICVSGHMDATGRGSRARGEALSSPAGTRGTFRSSIKSDNRWILNFAQAPVAHGSSGGSSRARRSGRGCSCPLPSSHPLLSDLVDLGGNVA